MGFASRQGTARQEKRERLSGRGNGRPSALLAGLCVGAFGLLSPVMAAEPSSSPVSSEATVGAEVQATMPTDGLASMDPASMDLGAFEQEADVSLDSDGLMSLGQYAPPPPRRYYGPTYRYYRPAWRLRVIPPPIFAPGWFGLYFFGNPPPPPVATPEYAPVPNQEVAPAPAPKVQDFRHVGEYSVSLMGGMHDTAYALTGQEVADPGARVALRYRNAPSLGAELAVGMYGSNLRFDNNGTDQRSDMPFQLSALIYAFPRSPIQPYLLLGATGNMRTYKYMYDNGTLGDSYTEVRAGIHGGLGLELNVADKVSFSVDTRRVIYTMVDRSVSGQTVPTDRQITGGLNFYF